MSDQTLSQLALSQLMGPDVISQVRTNVTLAKLIPVRPMVDATGPRWAVHTSNPDTNTHAEGSAISTFNGQGQAEASLGVGLYETPIGISDESDARAQLSQRPVQNRDPFHDLSLKAVDSQTLEINGDLINGTSTNKIIGLNDAIDASTTYAGITRNDNAYWRAHEFDQAFQLLSNSNMQQAIRDDLAQIRKASGLRPNFALVDPITFEYIRGCFDGVIVHNLNAQPGNPHDIVDTVQTMQISGCTFVEDSDGYHEAYNGTIFYLNSKYMHIQACPYRTDHRELAKFGQESFYMQLVAQPFSGNMKRASLRSMLQLVVERPNCMGKRINVNTGWGA